MTYLEFLEKVVDEFSKIAKGSVKLEIPVCFFKQPDLKATYIEVTFNKANFSVCLNCGINSEAYICYRNLRSYGDTESDIDYCVEWLRHCLESQILKLFVGVD